MASCMSTFAPMGLLLVTSECVGCGAEPQSSHGSGIQVRNEMKGA